MHAFAMHDRAVVMQLRGAGVQGWRYTHCVCFVRPPRQVRQCVVLLYIEGLIKQQADLKVAVAQRTMTLLARSCGQQRSYWQITWQRTHRCYEAAAAPWSWARAWGSLASSQPRCPGRQLPYRSSLPCSKAEYLQRLQHALQYCPIVLTDHSEWCFECSNKMQTSTRGPILSGAAPGICMHFLPELGRA